MASCKNTWCGDDDVMDYVEEEVEGSGNEEEEEGEGECGLYCFYCYKKGEEIEDAVVTVKRPVRIFCKTCLHYICGPEKTNEIPEHIKIYDTSGECGICMEEVLNSDHPRITRCGHLVCISCLAKCWAKGIHWPQCCPL
ncbi:hypothetical protein KI387_025794, partial [Taxus chinensis]